MKLMDYSEKPMYFILGHVPDVANLSPGLCITLHIIIRERRGLVSEDRNEDEEDCNTMCHFDIVFICSYRMFEPIVGLS